MEGTSHFRQKMISLRHNKNARNSFYSSVAFLSRPALQIIVTPILFYQLGDENFGVWMILQSIISLTFMADFGIAPATTLFIAKYGGMGESEDVLRILRGSYTLYLFSGVIIFVIFCMLGNTLLLFLNAGSIFNNSPNYFLPLFSICLALQMFHSLVEAVFRGLERYDLESILRICMNVSTLIGIAVLAYMNFSLTSMVILQASVSFLAFITSVFLLCRTVGSRVWLKPYCSFITFKEIFRKGIFGGIQGVSSVLFTQIDKLILASLIGPSATGYYSACMQLTSLAHGLMAKSLNFLFPKFASTAGENIMALRGIFTKGMVISTVCGSLMSLFLFVFGDKILILWLGENLPSEIFTALKILAVVNAFYATSIVPFTLLMGRGAFHLGAVFGFLSFFLVAVSALWLIPLFGIIGAASAKLTFIVSSLISRGIIMKITLSENRWWVGILHTLPVFLTFLFAWSIFEFGFIYSVHPSFIIFLQLTISPTVLSVTTKIVYGKWFWTCV